MKCNPLTEICRINSKCDDSKQDDAAKCIYCALKDDFNSETVSKTLLASSVVQQAQPYAPRLLAKSGGNKLLADNHQNSRSDLEVPLTNQTATSESSYDDYYVYDEDDTSDKNEFGEEDEYLDDYAENSDSVIKGNGSVRKLGICPKVLSTNDNCDSSKLNQSDCRFDTDCPGDEKCCASSCGNRLCHAPIASKEKKTPPSPHTHKLVLYLLIQSTTVMSLSRSSRGSSFQNEKC